MIWLELERYKVRLLELVLVGSPLSTQFETVILLQPFISMQAEAVAPVVAINGFEMVTA